MGNAELFELFETDPKMKCKECLLYWSHGLVYCTCGHLLQKRRPTEAPSNIHWTFSQFRTMWLRRDDLMATDMGKLHNKENIMLPIIWKSDASRDVLKGSTIAFWTILIFVHLSSSMIELKRSVSRWTSLRKIFLPSYDASRRFSIQKELVDFSKKFWKIQTNERSFWLQRYVVHIKPSTPRIWRTTTEASAILDVSILAPVIKFFLQLVAMERLMVEFIIIQRKSINEDAWKAIYDKTVQARCLPSLDKTSDERLSRFFCFLILLQLDRLQLAAVCCSRREV